MIILAKKSDETTAILSVVAVIAISALFAIFTQYGLKNITGLPIGTTQGNVEGGQGIEVVTTLSSPTGACNYDLVNFGTTTGGSVLSTASFISVSGCNDPKPFIIRNIGTEILDVQIYASNALFSGYPKSTFQFKIAEPDSITDLNLDNCAGTCFNIPTSITTYTNMPIDSPPIPDAWANAVNNLNYQDTNDEARVDIRIDVPVAFAGFRSSTVTFYGDFSNTF